MNFLRTAIVPSGAMTGTATITTQPQSLEKCGGCSYQLVWSGTPTGTFTVQVSNDYVPNLQEPSNPLNPGTWTALPGATITPQPSGSASNAFVPIFASCAYYIRISYTNASGSGTLSGMFAGKYFG